MKRLWWRLLNPPQYRKGMVLVDKQGKEITIQSREVSPYLDGHLSWTYLYEGRFGIGEAGLNADYKLKNKFNWLFEISVRHLWGGIYWEREHRTDIWISIPFVALRLIFK